MTVVPRDAVGRIFQRLPLRSNRALSAVALCGIVAMAAGAGPRTSAPQAARTAGSSPTLSGRIRIGVDQASTGPGPSKGKVASTFGPSLPPASDDPGPSRSAAAFAYPSLPTDSLPPGPSAHPVKVLLVGDGVLFDLAPALRAGLEASGASVQEQPWFGFGLSTPGVRDWRKLWPALVASVKPDVVVAFVGPWDLRPVTVAGVGPALVPGTDAWARWYTVQADAAVTALSSSGARVVWLGPTPEAAPGTAGAVSAMASVLERVAQDRGATFVDARAALGSSFRALITIMGDPLIRLYKPDGEHLCPEGAARLARIVLGPVAAVAPRRLYVNDSWVEGTWRSDPRYTVSAGIGGAC